MLVGGTTWKWWLRQVVTWLFGLIFLFSGAMKTRDPGLFLMNIRGFQMLADPYAAWLALALPWLEIFAGLSVITGWLRRGGLLLLNLCIAAFIVAMVFAMARGLNVECGCFGTAFKTSLYVELAMDAVLLAVGCTLLRK